MLPSIDPEEVDIDIVKDQIINLNDKFDYLLSLAMQDEDFGIDIDFTEDVSGLDQDHIMKLKLHTF